MIHQMAGPHRSTICFGEKVKRCMTQVCLMYQAEHSKQQVFILNSRAQKPTSGHILILSNSSSQNLGNTPTSLPWPIILRKEITILLIIIIIKLDTD